MTQAIAERTEKRETLSVPIKEIAQGQPLKAAVGYPKRRFGVKGKVIARGRVVKFGLFTLTLKDGQFEGLEYRVCMAPDGVLQAELVEVFA
jgi:hypothetical protein